MFPQEGNCETNGDDDGCTQFVPLYTRDIMYDNMEANKLYVNKCFEISLLLIIYIFSVCVLKSMSIRPSFIKVTCG